jgi:hypothetical protein
MEVISKAIEKSLYNFINIRKIFLTSFFNGNIPVCFQFVSYLNIRRKH